MIRRRCQSMKAQRHLNCISKRKLTADKKIEFYSIAIGTVLVDMAVFQHLSWIGIICIFLLEIVILLGLAKRLGSEHVTMLLDYLFHQMCEKIGLWPKN